MASHHPSSLRIRFFACLAAALAALSASATEYWWTGSAGDGLWSTAANWALDAEGATPVNAAPASGERATCRFDVPAAGLVVTQDTGARIVISSLIVTTSSTEPVEMKIVSPAQGSEFEFSPGGQITVGANATLVLNTDMGTSGSRETIEKFGDGTLAFDLVFASPASPRPVVVYAGRVVVLSTSQDVRHAVRLAGTDAAHPPVYENRRDGGLYKSLEAPGEGSIQLNGTTMKVGDKVDSVLKVTTAYTIPNVIDSGTLSFANEHSYVLGTKQPSYNIQLDRADVTYVPTVVGMQFEDTANPQKDDIGLSGWRLVPIGEPQVVNDAGRGNVLSLDGNSGFKGPDADNGLVEFNPNDGFTLSMWLKPAATCDSDAKIFFFGQGYGAASSVALRFYKNDSNKLFYSQFGTNTQFQTSGIRNGNWHHVAVVYNGAKGYTFFYDGAQVHTWTPAVALNVPNRDFFIGHVSASYASASSSYKNGANPYTGQIDDFFLSNREFSASEISAMYSNGLGSYSNNLTLQSVSAKSAGALSVPASASVKTISGAALAGGVEMTKPGSTLTVGTGAGETNTSFRGTVAGTDSTLVKAGEDYALTLRGAVKGVTNVVVDAGTLTLSRPGRSRNGLVCRYSFDDPANFGKDDGPAGFDLSPGDPGTPTAIAGVENGAIEFPDVEGGDAYLQTGSATRPANFPSGNDSFTVSVWIRPTAATCTTGAVICCWGGGGNGKMMLIRFNNANNKLMFVSSGEKYNLNVEGLPNLSDGQWHHIVATYDGTSRVKKMYCDGVLKGEKTITDGLDVNTAGYSIEIGHTTSSSSNSGKRYRGGMDEFMVFDYAWSSEEVAAEYSGIPVPAPAVHWTFDGENPLVDTTGTYTLEAFRANDAVPNVTFESGNFICGKAARFTKTSGCLRRETFPEGVLPSGKTNCTLLVRYRPDTTQIGDNYSRVAGWGGGSATELFALGTEKYDSGSVRAMLSDFNGTVPPSGSVDRTALGSDHTRWYTVALTFDKSALRIYVDGVLAKTYTNAEKLNYNLIGGRVSIGSSFTGTRDFYGLVDDVQIYKETLTAAQVRMATEQLEASKGKATTSTATPAGVLRDTPDVTVASGATLVVASTEAIGNLSGAGSVEIKSFGRLNVSSVNGFSGTVTGDGLIGIADGATLEFGDGSSPLLEINRPLALGANVTVNTTATNGRFLLALAPSFIDADNLASWTATVGNRKYLFAVSTNGTELYLLMTNGTVIIVQ